MQGKPRLLAYEVIWKLLKKCIFLGVGGGPPVQSNLNVLGHFLCITFFGILSRRGGVDQIETSLGILCTNIGWIRTHKRNQKHRQSCKMLPWEHHIGCQMSQIALSKSTENVFLTVVTAVTGWTVVRKITQSLNKKNHATSQQIFFCCFCFTFSVIFEKAIWQIWQPMWCSQGSALRFSQGFCGKVTWKFLVDRLRDFFYSISKNTNY